MSVFRTGRRTEPVLPFPIRGERGKGREKGDDRDLGTAAGRPFCSGREGRSGRRRGLFSWRKRAVGEVVNGGEVTQQFLIK